MKLKFHFTLLLISLSTIVLAQNKSEKSEGKIYGKVFFNYHIDNTDGVEQTSAFEIKRSYLGYKRAINEKFTATILFDAAKNSSGSGFTVFVKNAKLDYKADTWLTLSAGIIGLKQFNDQEKFWGYRYLFKSFADENKFGSSADLGFMAAMKINDNLKLDLLIVNGEGYKELQDQSGNNRFGADIVFTPSHNWTFKAYYDVMKGIDIDDATKETTVSNVALFGGYRTDDFRIGAEYLLLQNAETFKNAAKDKDLHGLSFYATYNINEKWNVFGRFDELSSNKLSGEINDWNFSNDGDTFITGFEFKPTKGVNTSINYRYTDFDDPSNNNSSLIFFNLEFYF